MFNRLWMWLIPSISGCDPGVAKSGTDFSESAENAGVAGTDDGGGSYPDACDDAPGEILCIEGSAVFCDEDGNVESQDECAIDSLCLDDMGCLDCTIPTEFPTDTVPRISIRPEMTVDNFGWERYHATAITFEPTGAAANHGSLNVSWAGDTFGVWTMGGEKLGTFFSVEAADLPLKVLLHSHGSGIATLEAQHSLCDAKGASIEVASQVQPPPTGHTQVESPWFQRVKVFNQDEKAYATLSPLRHPHQIDAPFDLYVTEHRQAEAWAANPVLTDIRDDGHTTHTMSGIGLPENRWLIWDDEHEIGDRQTANYDVIFDFNQNGELDSGDLSVGPGDPHGGFTRMGDLSKAGPSGIETFTYSGGWWQGQKVYYPTDIAERPPTPLVVISHGNGHDYLWYDYLGEHLASHGYVVMAHQNNTGPGIETASTTTLVNTDFFLEFVGDIADGSLAGHVDHGRIVWIGHSRGGEGVVRAFDRMVDEGYENYNYGPEDIVLISSIAPTVFNPVDESDPHDVTYHLFAGAADGDVTGGPNSDQVQFFRLTSASEGEKQVTYLQGVGHNEFNCCGFDDATGPDLVGRDATQEAAKAYYLALIRAHADGHEPSLDFFTRQANVFRPFGIDEDITIANEYRPHPTEGCTAIDDFQARFSNDIASSDASVLIGVEEYYEGELNDANNTFSDSSSDPMNGMTQACCDGDENRGAVFEWDEASSLVWELDAETTDFSPFTHLSIRAAQTTRHEYTNRLDAPLHFSISLTDSDGLSSTIWTGDTASITTPYARAGSGGGRGWANEFNTVRIRLVGFQDAEPLLNLSDVARVRLDFGGDFGSAFGRIGIDDLLLEY